MVGVHTYGVCPVGTECMYGSGQFGRKFTVSSYQETVMFQFDQQGMMCNGRKA